MRQDRHCTSIIGLMGPQPNGYGYSDCPVYYDLETSCVKFAEDGTLSNRCSVSLDVATFSKGAICVGLSKDKQGLPLSVGRCCDSYVHIPHLPLCGVHPLLDTPSSLSILLSHVCEFIGFKERAFHEHKFDVTRPTQHAFLVNDSDKQDACNKRQYDADSAQEVIE